MKSFFLFTLSVLFVVWEKKGKYEHYFAMDEICIESSLSCAFFLHLPIAGMRTFKDSAKRFPTSFQYQLLIIAILWSIDEAIWYKDLLVIISWHCLFKKALPIGLVLATLFIYSAPALLPGLLWIHQGVCLSPRPGTWQINTCSDRLTYVLKDYH